MNATGGETDRLTDEVKRGLIGLADAAKLMTGRAGKYPCLDSVRRWASRGYRQYGFEVEPLVLRTVLIGRDLLVHPSWVREFEEGRIRLGRLAQQAAIARRPPKAPARRAAAMHKRAERSLDRKGVR